MSSGRLDDPDSFHTPDAESARDLKRIARAILRDAAAADDVLQEAWLTAAGLTRTRGGERNWLTGIVRNLARNAARGELRRTLRDRTAGRGQRESESALEAAERRNTIAFVRSAVDALPEPVRSPVILRYLEELELKEVARRLGRSIPTVKDQIQRGMGQLRRALDREYGDSRTWGMALVAAFDWGRDEVETAVGGAVAGSALSAWIVLSLTAASASCWWYFARPGAVATEELRLGEVDREARQGLITERADNLAGGSLAPPEQAGREALGTAFSPANTAAIEPVQSTLVTVAVVNSAGGAIAGATVCSVVPETDERIVCGTTGPEGTLTLDVGDLLDERGRVIAYALAAGYAQSPAERVACAPGESTRIRVMLEAPELRVTGSVRDGDGVPIEGVRISVLDPDVEAWRPLDTAPKGYLGRETRTDAGGEFQLGHLLRRDWMLVAEAPGYVAGSLTASGSSQADARLDFVLSRGLVIEGRVFDAAGQPVPDARVYADLGSEQGETTTVVQADDRGAYVLSGLDPLMPIRVWARASTGATGYVVPGTGFDDSEPVDIVVSFENRLELRIVDHDGQPLPRAIVACSALDIAPSWHRKTTADELGLVALDDCPRAPLLILVSDPEFRVNTPLASVQLVEPPRERLEVVCAAGFETPATVTSWVREHTGVPARGQILVVSQDLRSSIAVDLDYRTGHFEVWGVLPGEYDLWLLSEDSALRQLGSVSLEASETVRLPALKLPERARLEASNAWNSPPDLVLDLYWSVDFYGRPRRESCYSGTLFPNHDWDLLAGEYWLVVWTPSRECRQIRRVQLESGEFERVHLGPDSPTPIRMILPAGRTTFERRDPGEGEWSAFEPDQVDDPFPLTLLEPGTYRCSVTAHDGRAGATEFEVVHETSDFVIPEVHVSIE